MKLTHVHSGGKLAKEADETRLGVPEGYKPLYSVAISYPKGESPTAATRKDDVVTYIK